MIGNKICVDSSFVANLLGLNNKEKKEKCRTLVSEETEFYAPDLIKYEFGNILKKYKNIRHSKIIRIFNGLAIEYFETDVNKTFKLAIKHELSFYDASYIAILKEDPTIDLFLTFDRDFRKVKNKRVKVLS